MQKHMVDSLSVLIFVDKHPKELLVSVMLARRSYI